MMQDQNTRGDMQGGPGPYLRFAGMISTSTVVMFVLTYTNVFDIAHMHFSQERLYMALVMGSAMAIVMMAWMWKMHPDRRRNLAIIGGAVVIGIAAFLFSQTQALVYDVNYMRGMIPHHSIAILTSERAGIVDVRVRALADEIIEAQRREIAEMEWLIRDIERTVPRRPKLRRPDGLSRRSRRLPSSGRSDGFRRRRKIGGLVAESEALARSCQSHSRLGTTSQPSARPR